MAAASTGSEAGSGGTRRPIRRAVLGGGLTWELAAHPRRAAHRLLALVDVLLARPREHRREPARGLALRLRPPAGVRLDRGGRGGARGRRRRRAGRGGCRDAPDRARPRRRRVGRRARRSPGLHALERARDRGDDGARRSSSRCSASPSRCSCRRWGWPCCSSASCSPDWWSSASPRSVTCAAPAPRRRRRHERRRAGIRGGRSRRAPPGEAGRLWQARDLLAAHVEERPRRAGPARARATCSPRWATCRGRGRSGSPPVPRARTSTRRWRPGGSRRTTTSRPCGARCRRPCEPSPGRGASRRCASGR